jgi:uncharacterized protein (DUF433 family)
MVLTMNASGRVLTDAGDAPRRPIESKMTTAMATAAKTVYSHVTKDPEVCGGKACVDGTRIRVMDVVSLKRQGVIPEKMLEAYPSLNLAQVYAALSYYYEHPEEIEASFAEDGSWEADHERAKAEYLSRKPSR